MRISFYILYLFIGHTFCSSLNLSDYDNIEEYYDIAIEFRKNGDSEQCLQMLLQIESSHIESNYVIAEIYLNKIKSPNIALDYYKQVMEKTYLFEKEKINPLKYRNLYRKSLFMTSYIYSNYLGMYSKAYESYEIFLRKFPNDELIESVKYEIELLRPLEENKNQIIRRSNG